MKKNSAGRSKFNSITSPNNLNIEEMLTQHPPLFNYKIEGFKHIIHLITSIPAYNKDILDKSEYIPINAKRLQNRVRGYRKYLDYLIVHGVLEENPQYIVGKRSRGFKFTQKYQEPIKIEETKKSNPEMKTDKYTKQMQEKYHYLYKWFNPSLRIDFTKALDFLNAELSKNKSYPYKALRKFNCGFLNCNRINSGEFYFNIDKNIHRLHTPLTNIKKELRNFITYDGMPLVAVDVKNSQPLLSGVLLNEAFYNTTLLPGGNNISFNYTSISKEVTTFFTNNTSLPSHLSSYIMVCKNAESGENRGFQNYIEKTESGLLYEFIENEIKANCNIEIANRKATKEIVFSTLFTDNRYIGQDSAAPKREFKRLFPEVYKVFAKLKQKDKKALSNILQSIESRLVLDYIAKRISDEKPDMPIFTIHDSVVCPIGNEAYVATVIKEEIRKAIGMNPEVSFEYWCTQK